MLPPTATNSYSLSNWPFELHASESMGIWTLTLHWVHIHNHFTMALIKHVTLRLKTRVLFLKLNRFIHNWGPLHTRDWESVTTTLQAVSMVEKAVHVQVCFTRCSRDQRSKRMQDGCKADMDSYMASNGSCFTLTWPIFQKPPHEGRPNTKLGEHGTLNAHNHWFLLFYHVWRPAWIEIHRNSICLRAWSHMTLHYTLRRSVSTLQSTLDKCYTYKCKLIIFVNKIVLPSYF